GSARRIGALDDITQALQQQDIQWEIFDQVEANPSIATVRDGGQRARQSGADFIIAIGGGSPMDAAKAIAVLALHDISDDQLLALQFGEALPLVAVPTTAGTGSEVTAASIITFPEREAKLGIRDNKLLPRVAILDPGYTVSLPWQITADTAVDAYSHAMESYLSVIATPISDMHARTALDILGPQLKRLTASREIGMADREALLLGSLLAGMAISETRVTIPHLLGYTFTIYKDIPHGRANGLLMPAFMTFNLEKSQDPKVKQVLEYSHFKDLQELTEVLAQLCGPPPVCSEAERQHFVDRTTGNPSLANNLVAPDREDLAAMLARALQ
ncbi:MAG TPA: iron-containing alcohol dehydrogenase, partial [Syntrophomonas sp.]|nr:iron-containing alcohol dehydrogenase [Syntrophomonas sp.]